MTVHSGFKFRGGGSCFFSILGTRANNRYSEDERVLRGRGTLLRDARGKRAGALIVLNDVTRLRKL